MRATSNYSVIVVLVVLVGFGLILSKYSVLPMLGVLLVLLGFFAPFYRDSVLKCSHYFSQSLGKTERVGVAEKLKYSGIKRWDAIGKRQSDHMTLVLSADSHVQGWNGDDLREAFLAGEDLSGKNLQKANLAGADLRNVVLRGVNLNGANLRGAHLNEADLSGANLAGANLSKADLSGANLSEAWCVLTDFTDAKLYRANLNGAVLRHASLRKAVLTGCSVYGISVWEVDLEGANQADLVITPPGEPRITIDDLAVAQFVSLLLNNRALCDVVNTITAKVVFILGHFNLKRGQALDVLREELRKRGYLPVVFDLDMSVSRHITEEILALAHMSRFVIVDFEDSENMFAELQHVVPNLSKTPFQPLLYSSVKEPRVLKELEVYPWFLHPYVYKDVTDLRTSLEEHVIKPSENFYDLKHSQDGDSLAAC